MLQSRDFRDASIDDMICSEDTATPSASSSSPSRPRRVNEPLSQRPLASVGPRSASYFPASNSGPSAASDGQVEELDEAGRAMLQLREKMLQQRQRMLQKQ